MRLSEAVGHDHISQSRRKGMELRVALLRSALLTAHFEYRLLLALIVRLERGG
jgi:hypothetical protein